MLDEKGIELRTLNKRLETIKHNFEVGEINATQAGILKYYATKVWIEPTFDNTKKWRELEKYYRNLNENSERDYWHEEAGGEDFKSLYEELEELRYE